MKKNQTGSSIVLLSDPDVLKLCILVTCMAISCTNCLVNLACILKNNNRLLSGLISQTHHHHPALFFFFLTELSSRCLNVIFSNSVLSGIRFPWPWCIFTSQRRACKIMKIISPLRVYSFFTIDKYVHIYSYTPVNNCKDWNSYLPQLFFFF